MGIGIVQNQLTDSVLQKCHRRIHAVVTGKGKHPALAVPPLRMGLRLQHKLLSHSQLILCLVQRKHGLRREILIQIHGIMKELEASHRTQVYSTQTGIDTDPVHHGYSFVRASVIVIYRIQIALLRSPVTSRPEPVRITALIGIGSRKDIVNVNVAPALHIPEPQGYIIRNITVSARKIIDIKTVGMRIHHSRADIAPIYGSIGPQRVGASIFDSTADTMPYGRRQRLDREDSQH